MSIGVSYDDFWYGEPEKVKYAIATYELTAKKHAMDADVLAWNTGRYVLLAVSTVLSQAFSRSSTAKYPSEPIVATELDEKLAAQKRERELIKQRDGFLALAFAMANRNNLGEPPVC